MERNLIVSEFTFAIDWIIENFKDREFTLHLLYQNLPCFNDYDDAKLFFEYLIRKGFLINTADDLYKIT